MSRNRLFYDIETSCNVILDFSCGYNKSINYNQIVEERKIICICYKWEHSPKVYSLEWDSKKCDKKMLKDFIKILNKADEIIAHNGDRFDIKWIRGRCFIHGIDMMPSYTSIDTLKLARSQFNLNSNRLDYLSQLTGGDGKIKTNWQMWVDITLHNKKSALRDMVTYCKKDVIELERVYKRMANFIKPKTSLASDKSNCPECDSENTIISKTRVLASGTKTIQFRCKDCGKYHSVSARAFNLSKYHQNESKK